MKIGPALSLKASLVAAVVLFGMLSMGLVGGLVIAPHLNRNRLALLDDIRTRASHLQGVTQQLMRHRDPEGTRGLLATLDSGELHRLTVLIGPDGRIVAASAGTLAGHAWTELSLAVNPTLAGQIRAGQYVPLLHEAGTDLVQVYAPVCWTGDGKQIRPRDCGFLFQEYDLSPATRAGRQQVLWAQGILAFGVAAACFAILLLLRHLVTDRTDRLREVISAFVAGDRQVRAHLPGGDEITLLGDGVDSLLDVVTEAQRATQASERKFRDLVENSADWIWEIDAEGVYTYSSPQSERILGYKPEEIVGRTPFDFMPEEEARRVALLFREYTRLHQPFSGLENVNRTRDGRIVTLETSAVPVFDATGTWKGYRGIDRDVTERRRIESEKAALERELMHGQKMQALGRLTGGVAHEFNNLLTSIRGFAKLAIEEADDPEGVRSSLAVVIEATDQAAALTGQMLGFARKKALEPKIVPVSEVLESLQRLVKPLLGKTVAFSLAMEDPDARIEVDPVQMVHGLLNLVINARDAMPEGGALDVRSRMVAPRPSVRRRHPSLRPCPHVEIAVADTGTGMDAETQARIFEPFFSTKEVGKGTGLGLAMVYGFIEQSGGVIEVESTPGEGTTFTILLPQA